VPESDGYLRIAAVSADTGDFTLRDISLSCCKGDIHILMGPTGSGKSTLLKCILGLRRVRSGRILLKGEDITATPPEQRRMGYVPQNCALFPHLTVLQNLLFGIEMRRSDDDRRHRVVGELSRLLDIEHLLGRRPRDLSGGEAQKVAIGRALAIQPKVLLLDEPFASIDEGSKRNLWLELKRIVRQIGITTLHITHNLEEAFTLGEHVTVLINGTVVQSGYRSDVFETPCCEEVARFLNYRNIFSGTFRTGCKGNGGEIDIGHFVVRVGAGLPDGERVNVCIRPKDIKILKEGIPLKKELQRNCFTGQVAALYELPDQTVLHFVLDGSPCRYDFELKFPLYISRRLGLHTGKQLQVAFWEPSIIVFRDTVSTAEQQPLL